MQEVQQNITPMLVIALQGGIGWAIWNIRKAFVRSDDYKNFRERSTKDIQENNAKVIKLEGRLRALEEKVAQSPDNSMFSDLAGAVESLRGDIKTLDMRITGVDRLMQRLERALDKIGG